MPGYKKFPEIEQQKIYDGIQKWHDAGFQGKGINVWNTESNSDHGQTTTRRIYDAAPDCNVLQAGLSLSTKKGAVTATCTYKGKEYVVEEFIERFNIKAVNRSMGGGAATNTALSNFWKELQTKYNLLICNSAGNDGSNGCGGAIPPDVAIYVGACGLAKGKPQRDNYSSIGEEIDFMHFRGIWNGTSFASPYFLGIGVLFKSRFNPDMTQQEIFKLMKMISEDMDIEGYDIKTGWGLPKLFDVDKKYITMTTKSKEYYVNGFKYIMDTNPVNKEGTVFVPVRAITENLKCTVGARFNVDKTIKVLIEKDNLTVELNTDSDIALFHTTDSKTGKKYTTRDYLNFAPYIDENNRTLVPVRFIAEAFNCHVDWVQSESKVMILEK